MTETLTVHVASRSPSILADGGEGEFVWRRDRVEAAAIVAGWAVEHGKDDSVNIALTSLEVPYDGGDYSGVGRWLQSNWRFIEVDLFSD